MNWLTNFIRPRIRSLVQSKEVPDNLWQKCPACAGMLFHRDLKDNLNVCYHCGHHLRITIKERLPLVFDGGQFQKIDLPEVPLDPLKFRDRKRYIDRLREAQSQTGLKDAMTLAKGTIGGQSAIVAAFNFSFMGGSMGLAVGEAIVRAAEEAVKTRSALIIMPASGGARMQESMLSLMQMPRTVIAVEMVKAARLPYIVYLIDPTTGGVTASFAMLGDIHMAEPGATIGFAGRRVIEETVRETLPPDFQTAEYLRDHGIVDIVVPRAQMHETLARVLRLLMHKNTEGFAGARGGGRGASAGGTGPRGLRPAGLAAGPEGARTTSKAEGSKAEDNPAKSPGQQAARQVKRAQKAIKVLRKKKAQRQRRAAV